MTGTSRLTAAVGVIGLLFASRELCAQDAFRFEAARIAAVAVGSIEGVVQDERGAPIGGAAVSALGATTTYSFTDRNGRFVLTLSPGPYLVRAHLPGFVASRGQMVEVRANSRSSSSIALHRAAAVATPPTPAPVLAAGVGAADTPAAPAAPTSSATTPAESPPTDGDDHGELAWRLRHLRRGVLQEATVPEAIVVEELAPAGIVGGRSGAFARAAGSSARLAANLLGSTPFSGQLNLLTTSSFDNPQQLFSGDNLAHGVAYLSVGAPAGSNADWAVRGAFTQADISSWLIAGAYSTRGPARHRYDIGLSYATQRYDGGNPAALRGLTDGSRNAGEVYGFDAFTIAPAIVLTYGMRYARYDYLEGRSLLSPRLALTVSPAAHLRVNALVSQHAIAPGAEEFLPPGDNGVWLPPQRTFSPLSADRRLDAERTSHVDFEVERDLGASSAISVRAFRQDVDGQLVTAFGVDVPGLPAANVGHYFVGNYGDMSARGVGLAFRTAVAGRVRGSIAYSMTQARWNPGEDLGLWLQPLPLTTTLRASRVHDVSTRVETEVPETSTRILVLYRVSNAFARRNTEDDGLFDSRFDVQVRQSLPFMDFSTAKWEMLIGVRNFFREMSADQSVYDELLVVHPPKRIVGGLTMRF
jgi:carboxypeptidase family protein/TonB-dependent receptor-like protein